MEKKFNFKLIPKGRLLNIYITLIHDLNPKTIFTYSQIKSKLKEDFDFETSLEQIRDYYEPNFYEHRLDIEQQMKNLQIRYD